MLGKGFIWKTEAFCRCWNHRKCKGKGFIWKLRPSAVVGIIVNVRKGFYMETEAFCRCWNHRKCKERVLYGS